LWISIWDLSNNEELVPAVPSNLCGRTPAPKDFPSHQGWGISFQKKFLGIKEQKEGHKTKKSIKRKTENKRKI
jgi:hypothetical protein